uniref:Dyslexia susceptibility 1 candidate gene 1 protein homolog n=2 Tax=Cacopsylla melanoneura TaxID=428564 RepID=A0A8D8Z6E4_9HEMI
MPLIVKETSWRQTPAKVFIVVPLNGIPTHKVDMFTSERYIKLHYGNYIFEKLLLHPVNEEASTIRVNNNEAEFELIKVEEAMWDHVEVQVSKKEAIELKIKLMEEYRERVKRLTEEMLSKKDKRSKEAVSIQMKQETDEQSVVNKLKEEQKWEALSGNYQRQDRTTHGEQGNHEMKTNGSGHDETRDRTSSNSDEFKLIETDNEPTSDEEMTNGSDFEQDETLRQEHVKNQSKVDRTVCETLKEVSNHSVKNGTSCSNKKQNGVNGQIMTNGQGKGMNKSCKTKTLKDSKDIDDDEPRGVIITELTEEDVERIENEEKLAKQRYHKDLMDKITRKVRARIQAEEKQKATPIVRSQGLIGVKFTPRVFPTPMRESMAPEEEEWLKKQAEARQACGFLASDLRPEENNPDWVKAKADQMFKAGNYMGAVSAYSHGIKLCPKLASLYSNRAAAHIAMNNMFKAVDDAAEAIKLLTPPCEANRKSRIQAHVRRGTALCGLKAPKLGLLDYEAALALSPKDERLKEDTERVRTLAAESTEDEGDLGNFDFSSPPLVVAQ